MNAESDLRPPALRAQCLGLYWGSITFGVVLPWLMQWGVDAFYRHRPSAEFLEALSLSAAGAEPGFVLQTALGAGPFMIYGVFALFHLGLAHRHGPLLARRRRLALLTALAAMAGIAIWGHIAILTSRGSTAALGFLFLPMFVLVALPLGYGLGRWIGGRTIRARG